VDKPGCSLGDNGFHQQADVVRVLDIEDIEQHILVPDFEVLDSEVPAQVDFALAAADRDRLERRQEQQEPILLDLQVRRLKIHLAPH
jgi:hypothetical protein